MQVGTRILVASLGLSVLLLPAPAAAQAAENPSGFTVGSAGILTWVRTIRTILITAPVEEGKRKKLARDLGTLADELHALEGEKRRFTDLLLEASPDLNLLRQKMGTLRERVSKVENQARAISVQLPEGGRTDLAAIGEKLRSGLDEKAERLDDIYKDVAGLQRSSGRPDLSTIEEDGKQAIKLLREAIDHTVALRRALQTGG
jgi:chromosome segregation ATPase